MRKEKCDENQIKCQNLGSSQKLKNGDGKQNAVLRTFFLASVLCTQMEVQT